MKEENKKRTKTIFRCLTILLNFSLFLDIVAIIWLSLYLCGGWYELIFVDITAIALLLIPYVAIRVIIGNIGEILVDRD